VVPVIVSLQPLLVGAMLAWAGTYKLAGRTVGVAASRSALPKLLGSTGRATLAYRVTGGIELAVAVALLVTGSVPVAPAAATVVGVGFLAYLGYARKAAPTSSCGCTSSRAEPIGWRSFARAAIVAAGGLASGVAAAIGPTGSWWSALADKPLPAVAVVVLEAALVLALSPDFDRTWLVRLRMLRMRFGRHPLADIPDTVPVNATAYNLERSEVFYSVAHLVRTGLLESWDVDGWRILTYGGRDGDRPVTLTFAVGLDSANLGIRASVVDESTGEVLPIEESPVRKPLPVIAQ
jgi:methylamine utilization protein MauE